MNSAPKSLDSQGLDSLGVPLHTDRGHTDQRHTDRGHHASLEPRIHPEAHPHSHIHDEASLRRLINRLSRLEGHIRGIKTMIQEHRPCPEVLTQVAAVRGALDKVACTILDEHLTECVVRAAKQGDTAKIDEEIAQLRSALKQFF
ncbi:MAG: metal-sensitive transcriptional regulator [Prochlorotrichaceae cyanobacterium]|jgi:DNA-binding FrmR family transcriptional regulator